MPSEASMQERLSQLERSQRRLRRVVLGLVVGLAGAWCVAAVDDRPLEGHALKLTDADGRVRVVLTASNGLSLLDAGGTPRVALGVDADGPGLVLSGDASRAILSVNADGPALTYTGAAGRLRAILALVKGDPGLVFFDADERERLALAVRGAAPQMALRNADGGTTWQMPARP
jgi:hypothetical protein